MNQENEAMPKKFGETPEGGTMNFLKSFLSFLFDWQLRCSCCGTTQNVNEHGYAGMEYCDPCAIANGYTIYTAEQLRCHCKD